MWSRRQQIAAGLAIAAVLLLASGPTAGGATGAPRLVRLTATPALFPAYAPTVHDYVVRCADAASTRISTWAAAGTSPMIDGVRRPTATLPLRPGRAVTVEARSPGGTESYHVRCLPADFPTWQVTKGSTTPKRWYIATPTLPAAQGGHYVVIYDGNGVPVWWYRDAGAAIDAKLLPGPSIAYSEFNGASPAYQVRRLDGTLVQRITSPDGQIDDHDLQTTSAGNRYYLVYDPKQHVDLTSLGGPADATALEGKIEEISPAGKLLWSWTTDGHVDPSESSAWAHSIVTTTIAQPDGSKAYDVYHANSVSVLGNVVLLSLRFTNSIFAIDRTSGAILWKLGGTPTPESLAVLDDPLASLPFSGQHDARLLPDGTVTVFDDESFVDHAPRAVHYRIDTTAKTATLLQSVADPAVTASPCCGSARLLADGDWVVSWGGDPVFGEYRPDGTPVIKIAFDGLFSYRVVPVAASPLPAAALRAGMDAMR